MDKKISDLIERLEDPELYVDAVDEAAQALQDLADQLEELWNQDQFHPRAAKLMAKRKNFVVVADDEPYFITVYVLIRNNEKARGRWSDEDEARFLTYWHKPGAKR